MQAKNLIWGKLKFRKQQEKPNPLASGALARLLVCKGITKK